MQAPAANFLFLAMAENDRSDLKASNDRGHRILMNGCDDASTVAASARRRAACRGTRRGAAL
jgi:hypothetical protein